MHGQRGAPGIRTRNWGCGVPFWGWPCSLQGGQATAAQAGGEGHGDPGGMLLGSFPGISGLPDHGIKS